MSADLRRTGNKTYDIKEITDHQLEIARRIAVGQPPRDIARELGITMQSVSNIRNHPIINAIIVALHEKRDTSASDIAQQIAAIAPKAIRLINNVIDFANVDLENPDEVLPATAPEVKDQVRAALGIVKTVAPRLNLHKHIITNDIVNSIKKRALEGIAPADVVDNEEV